MQKDTLPRNSGYSRLFTLLAWIIEIAVDDSESALTLRHYFLGACNSPRLTRVRVLVHDEVIEDALRLLRRLNTTANETWEIYSRNSGFAFVRRIALRPRRGFESGACENEIQQKI